jgi:hypothetical protein
MMQVSSRTLLGLYSDSTHISIVALLLGYNRALDVKYHASEGREAK